MQSPPGSLLAAQYASVKASNKAEGPCVYLDVTGAQALLSSQQLPAYRGQSAAAGTHGQCCSSPGVQQRRAQTAGCIQSGASAGCVAVSTKAASWGSRGSDSTEHASSSAVPYRRPRWDDRVVLPTDPTFAEALQAWQQEVERGVYAPKLLGSITAVSSGRLKTAAGSRRPGSRAKSPLGRSAARPQTYHTTTAITSTSTAAVAAASTGAASTSALRCSRSSDSSGAAAVTPVVFQGSGENALQALEAIVIKHLVARPHLTLMQLQRAVHGISQLDSPCQLAAIGVLVKAGFWLAAMQVAYADGLSVLSDVLVEMRAIIDMGLHWENQALAAAAWSWAQVDRDLLLHTFRASDLTAQYLQLRKQLIRLQQLQLVARQQQQRMQQRSPLAAYNGLGGSTSSVSALKVDCHPDLARAERVLLINIIDSYLEHIAATAEAAVADDAAAGPLSSRLVGCYAGFEADAAAVRKAGRKGKTPKKNKQWATSSSASPLVQSCSTLQISSDWKIQLDAGEQVDLSDVDSDSSGSSSSNSRSSDSSDHTGHIENSEHAHQSSARVEVAQAAADQQLAPRAQAEQSEPLQAQASAQERLGQGPQAGTAVLQQPEQPQQQVDAALSPPPLPAQPCSRPQSHQASRRCSTAQGSRPGTAQRISSAAGTHQQQPQQQWPPAVGSILAFAGAGSTSHNSSHSNSMGRSYSHSGSSSIGGGSSQAGSTLSDGLPLSPNAAARMRPGSAASGLSKLSRPGSSSIETRPRPGSAATGIGTSLSRQQQEGCIPESGVEGLQGDAAGLNRFKEACAQHRQDLQNWAEESAVSLDAAPPGASDAAANSTAGAAAGKTRLSHAGSTAAGHSRPASAIAGRSRPASAASGPGAAALSSTPTLPGTRPSTGAAAVAGSSRLSSGGASTSSSSRPGSSAGAAAVAASTRHTSVAESQGHCSVYSHGGDLLYSTSKGLLSPHDTEPCSQRVSETGGSCGIPSGDSAGAAAAAGGARASAPGEDSAKEHGGEQRRSSAPGRTSPVPHLPLREAGLIAPDQADFEVKVARAVSANAANSHAGSGAGAFKGVTSSKSKAAGKAAGSAAVGHSVAVPVKSAKKPAAAAKTAAGASAHAPSADGQGAGKKGLGLKGSLTSMFAKVDTKQGKQQQQQQQQQLEPQQPPQQAEPLQENKAQQLPDSTAAAADAAQGQPRTSCTADPAASVKGPDAPAAAQMLPAVPDAAAAGPAHNEPLLNTSCAAAAAAAAAAAVPAQEPGTAQVPLRQQQQQPLQQAAEGTAFGGSSGTQPQQAAPQPVETVPTPAAGTQADTSKSAAAVVPAPMAFKATDKQVTPAAVPEAAPPLRPFSADKPVHDAEDQLIVELTQTMQQFQQHLQQTALMAQQLLAQQVAGQAAREAKPSSNSNSRPSSAAAQARRLSAANSSDGSRPGSRGQQRLSAAGTEGHGSLPGSLMGAQGAAGGVASQGHMSANPGLMQNPGFMLEDVLEADEPPTAEEVQAYAQYLGMDPLEDAALLYLAEEALLAPVPPGWTVHLDAAQNEYFNNTATGVSTYEHPLDEHYRQLYQQKKLNGKQH